MLRENRWQCFFCGLDPCAELLSCWSARAGLTVTLMQMSAMMSVPSTSSNLHVALIECGRQEEEMDIMDSSNFNETNLSHGADILK